jgi:sugar/nucleoside kinase (ribokinase family)
VGLCVLDHLFVVDDYRLPDVRTRYSDRLVSPGGMVSTALAQAAQMGCDARLLSLVGDDAPGRSVTRVLRSLGVNTRRVVRSTAHPTTAAVVLVDRRTRDRRFLLPDRRALERSAPDFDLAALRRLPRHAGRGRARTVLLVDGHFPAQAKRAVRRAKQQGVPVVADFASPRADFLRLLPHVEFPVLPLEFVAAWGVGGPRETLKALSLRYGGTPVVTLGARGAMVLHEGRIHAVPAPRVRMLDTTGAGDVLHGAFAAGLSQGRDVLPALRAAVREASRSCSALGGLGRLIGRTKSSGARAARGRG